MILARVLRRQLQRISPATRRQSGPHYHLRSPRLLRLPPPLYYLNQNKSPILVNRGWVPRSWRGKALDASEDEPLPSSSSASTQERAKTSWWRFWSNKREGLEERLPSVIPVEVIGVVRGSEKPSIFVPANDPSASQWFYVDIPALARACGLPEKIVYIEEISEHINPSSPYPIPKDFNVLIRTSVMPQDHLNYTLTWYSLSVAVTFMAIKRLKPQKSRR